jgi:hypothetical protein
MKKSLVLCFTFAATAWTKDFFPLNIGDAWNFSYESRTAAVIPEAPVTFDSGSVRWEVFSIEGSSVSMLMHVQEKRSLDRRRHVQNAQTGYDSIFSPPRVILDTIVFRQGVAPFDTGRVRDSIINAVSFSTATCAAVLHDPTKPVPAALIVKDTVMEYNGSSLDCIATVPSLCSSLGTAIWSFILADSIGPVEIAISPSAPGSDYFENRYLLSREYDTPVKNSTVITKRADGIVVAIHAGHIRLTQPHGRPIPVSGILYDASGRIVRTFPRQMAGAVAWDTQSLPFGMYLLNIETTYGNMAKPLFLLNDNRKQINRH